MYTENQKKLIDAIKNNNLAEIKNLISQDPKIINDYCEAKTPIMFAVEKGKKEVFDLLVENGADLEQFGSENKKLLHFAAIGGNLEIIKTLIDKKFDVNAQDLNGKTPIVLAAENGKKEAFDLLLANNADLNILTAYKHTLLHFAAMGGNIEIIRTLINKKLDVNAKNIFLDTPLMLAVTYGKKEAVNMLIANGADVNTKGIYNITVLHDAVKRGAVKRGYIDIIKNLIDNKADVNAESQLYGTPINAAMSLPDGKIKSEIVSILVKNGAKLDIKIGKDNILQFCLITAIATAITAVILAIASAPFWILAPVAAGVALLILGVSVYDNKTKNDAILKIAKDFETEQEAKSISGDKSKTQETAKTTEIAQNPTSQRDKLDEQNHKQSISNGM